MKGRTFKFNPTPEPLTVLQGGLSDTSRGPGRPRKTTDAYAQEKNDDIQKIRDLNVGFALNEMTNQIEYTGVSDKTEILEGDKFIWLGSDLAQRFGQTLPDPRLKSAVHLLAHENSFDPRRLFLEHCVEEFQPSDRFDYISTDYFKNDSDVANQAMSKMMIGAVARAYEPGCTMSWLPILLGAQGKGKSIFIKSLTPRELVAEMSSDLPTLVKEAYRLHTAWILELPECDQFFKPAYAEILKNLITLQVDEIRRPYELPSKAKRGFVFIGSSNEYQLLVDSTGNRRFIPIRIADNHNVPWRKLVEERGSLWAAAVQRYKAGEAWEYTSEELARLSRYQESFLERDAWWTAIEAFVKSKQMVTTADILRNAIDISTEKTHNGHQRRVGRVMRALGWESTSRKINGSSARVWVRTKTAEPILESLSDF